MTSTDAPPRRPAVLRAAAIALLVGTALYVVPSALHGNPPIDSARDTLEYVHQRPSWWLVHLVNIAAVLLWAGAFTALIPVVAPAARALGRVHGVVFTAAAAVFAVYFSIHAFGLTTVVDQYFEQGADQAAVLERAETVLVLLGSTAFIAQAMLGAAIALTGFVLSRSVVVPAWLGWAGVVLGAGWLTGAVAVNFAVVVLFTALTWAWTAVLGVLLLKTARPVPASG
ncbi:uncharacterized protein DUF4386 [Herbihabitans rhizosphaerae]|uniref:Uncharacterized protein DUF4386 n=1 Tax=Herbihabitans rhizosphaerae TaxID=1872711 RepID=A0A4Q7L691_9PSEU|nr:DUF4386 family protein [Herbihabitans rhizosphaerae]RZS44855.1 uncharacterized protein DUF4386 [Herbihabitans rhizosphaerae]